MAEVSRHRAATKANVCQQLGLCSRAIFALVAAAFRRSSHLREKRKVHQSIRDSHPADLPGTQQLAGEARRFLGRPLKVYK